MNEIALARCKSYERNEVERAVERCLTELGGLGRWLAPGQKVLVKPNILAAEPPEKGVNTHPEVVRAVLKALLDYGVRPIVGDSPGIGSLARAAEKAGIAAVCRELDVPLAAFNEEVEVRTAPGGKILKSFPLAREVTEVEAVINLPRVKTHGLTRLTCAVKNLFGCIAGLHKGEMHFRLQRADVFQEMLIDLVLTVKPVLTLVDGVIAMEGAGPRHGKLRLMGLVIAGENCFAVDATVARLIGLEPADVPVLALAAKRGIAGSKENEIKLLGEKLEDLIIPDFKVPAAKNLINLHVPDWVVRLVRRFVSPYPVIRAHCRRCLVCQQACPAKVITMSKDKMVIDDRNCIRCYCCQELCPYDAIELKVPLGGRFI